MTEWQSLYRQAMAETDQAQLQETLSLTMRAMTERERELSQMLARIMQEQMSLLEARQSLELLARESRGRRGSDVA
jgi:5-carboxymethyl-2-hydroxymuconate isomerase